MTRVTGAASSLLRAEAPMPPAVLDILLARVDLVRTIGVRRAWRRFFADRLHQRALVDRRLRVPADMWRAAASDLGATVDELAPGLLEISLAGAVTRIRGQTTTLDDPVAIDLAENKALAYALFERHGVPVARRTSVDARDVAAATQFVAYVGGPCLVKPARGGGGEGITGNVRSARDVRRALRRARRVHARALVEQQFAGDAYRILLLDGAVLDVLRRWSPRVTGDGRRTIEQIMHAEYERRISSDGPDGLKPFTVDLDCVLTLRAAGLSLSTVLPAGETAVVRTATNYNGPDETETYRGELHPEVVGAARAAANAVGVRLAGVDVLTPDPTVPLVEAGGVVLEVNAVPGLTHHYNTSDGDGATPIAVAILRTLLDEG